MQQEQIKYATITGGERTTTLWAINQELRANIAEKAGNMEDANKHQNAAKHLRNSLSLGLHKSSETVLAYPLSGTVEENDVNAIIRAAMKDNAPAITLTKKEESTSLGFINQSLAGSPVDEFDPTVAQLADCKSKAALKAEEQILINARTFNPSSFDPNTQDIRIKNGQPVVISLSELAVLTQRINEECSSRLPMENIINKAIADQETVALYHLFPINEIDFNAAVRNKLDNQLGWILSTAKLVGWPREDVELLLQNSLMFKFQQTPDDMLKDVYPAIIEPGAKIPTSFPEIISLAISVGLITTQFATVLGVVALAIQIFFRIKETIRKRKLQDVYDNIQNPATVAPEERDANKLAEDGSIISPNDSSTNSSSSNIGLVVGGLAALGIGIALVSNNRKSDSRPNKFSLKKYEDIEYSEV